jgi:hypothetical protein
LKTGVKIGIFSEIYRDFKPSTYISLKLSAEEVSIGFRYIFKYQYKFSNGGTLIYFSLTGFCGF